MSWDDLSDANVTCTRENRIMRQAQIFLVEVKGVCHVGDTARPFEDVSLIYKVGPRVWKDWVFQVHHKDKPSDATIYLTRESGCRSVEDVYRKWYDSAKRMGRLFSEIEVNITRIDEE